MCFPPFFVLWYYKNYRESDEKSIRYRQNVTAQSFAMLRF